MNSERFNHTYSRENVTMKKQSTNYKYHEEKDPKEKKK